MKEGQEVILEKLRNGEALEKFRQLLIAQGVREALANELCIKRNYDFVFGDKAKYLSTIRSKGTGYFTYILNLYLVRFIVFNNIDISKCFFFKFFK